MNILVLSGPNHRFADSAAVIHGFLSAQPGLTVTLSEDKNVFASPDLNQFDACVFGTGFTRSVAQPDGTVKREADLTPAQEDSLFQFVAGGKGLVGIHGTGWWIGGRG